MDPARVVRGKQNHRVSAEGEERVKKLIISLLLVGACRTTTVQSAPTTSTNPAVTPGMTGAPDAVTAVRGFMAAVKQTDLQAIGGIWGDKDGPARDRYPRQELEQREIIMAKCLRHDSYEIVGDAPAVGGARAMVLNLRLGDISRSADFVVVRGPSQRWYVQDVTGMMERLRDICQRRS
jgi:hypothetical protein